MKNNWFEIKALSSDEGEVKIHGIIGDEKGSTFDNFKSEWEKIKKFKKVNIRIHSRGGNVMDAAAIAAMIEEHPGETTGIIEGLAASCAADIAQSVKKRKIVKGGYMMIHKPLVKDGGNADELRDSANLLDKIQKNFLGKLMARAKIPEDQVNAMLNAGTWMTAEEALANGFVDEIMPGKKMAAFAGNCEFSNLPENAKQFFPEQFGLDSNKNSADAGKQPEGATRMSKEVLGKMKELFGAEFATEAYAADKNLETAAIEFVGKLQKDVEGLKKSEGEAKAALAAESAKIKTLETAAVAKDAEIKGLKEGTIPLGSSADGDGAGKETFEGKVEEIMGAMKCTKAKAVPMAVKQFPELHAAYIEKINKK